jgi:hypothetical protein
LGSQLLQLVRKVLFLSLRLLWSLLDFFFSGATIGTKLWWPENEKKGKKRVGFLFFLSVRGLLSHTASNTGGLLLELSLQCCIELRAGNTGEEQNTSASSIALEFLSSPLIYLLLFTFHVLK